MSEPQASATPSLAQVKQYHLPTAVLAMDGNPDGKTLYAACFDGGIYRVDVNTGVYIKFGSHDSYASGVRYLAPSNQIVSAGYDGELQWFDAATGAQIRKVVAHDFWSWKMRVSPDSKLVASVTGQYMAGGYKYEPAPEREPSVRVYDAATGTIMFSLPHIPPTLSTAFSPDSKYLAAANMMGEVRVWSMETGKLAASWNTPDFTSWGIIKSNHYIGGIFDMCFTPDSSELLVCGMGPMPDPMAGNGKQTWQRFAWKVSEKEKAPRKTGEIANLDAGHGLMEVIRSHPDGRHFLMAGRLAQGKWNTAIFELASGKLITSLDCGMRTTDAVWLEGGKRLALGGAGAQENKKAGKYPNFGFVKLFTV